MNLRIALLASVAVTLSPAAVAQSGTATPALAPAPKAPTGSATASPTTVTAPATPQSTAGVSAADDAGLSEIVITAQRREQNLQDVPVAVTAITADQLEARGIAAVTDIVRVSPSLTISENTNATGSSIKLRGIGTFAFSIGIEPSVAIVVDDVALLQQAQAFSGLSDIERLEVLRGPQGTLFGKNASAGVINIVTQAPTKQLTGAVGAVATTDEQYRVEGMLSGPLSDKAGFRLNAFYDDRKGYIRNLNTGNKLNGERNYGVRGRLDIDPIDTLNVALTGSYSKTRSNGLVRTIQSFKPGANVFGALFADSAVGTDVGDRNYRVRLDTEPVNVSKQAMFTGKAALDLGSANLVSITAYQDWRFRFREDFDQLGTPTLTNPAIATSPRAPNGSVATAGFHARNFSQELRLVSSGSRRLDYLFALFYANGDTDRDYARSPNNTTSWVADATTRTLAAFTQLTYDVTDTTHVDAGLRFSNERITGSFLNTTAGAPFPANNATCRTECSGRSSDDQITYKVALRQDLTDAIVLYGSYATGYKGQGYDISTGFTPARAADPVRSEASKAYEIGLKSRFLDNKVQLNVTGFWTDFKDFQAQAVITLPDGTTQPQLSNVGALRSRGIEADLSARPTRLLRIDASAAYTDAKIRDFRNSPCYNGQTLAQGCVRVGTTGVQDLSGERLANAPRFKYNIAVTQDIELATPAFDAFVTADYAHQSSVNFDLLGSPVSLQRGYGVVNGSVGIQGKGNREFRIALFVNNLFDQEYTTALQYAGNSNAQAVFLLLPRNARRYAGVRMRAGF